MPITKEKAPSTLPDSAKDLFVGAWNGAYEGTCKESESQDERDACASKIAWSAVKNKYAKGEDGTWHAKADILNEFSFVITKASIDKSSGQMRWMAVASDTDEDSYKQRMSLELFSDFITRAQQDVDAPVEFRSEYWKGGMPYLSVSHYDDFNGMGSAGETVNIYIDGNRLKAKGICYDTPLGRAAFNAIKESLDNPNEDNKVRISIGFLDWKHTHNGVTFERKSIYDICPACRKSKENVVFLRGQLIHLALTRVPVNQRTTIEAEVTKSMTTRKEDAESIVGAEEAEKLEELSVAMVGKSEALVIKADSPNEPNDPQEANDLMVDGNGAHTGTSTEDVPNPDTSEQVDRPKQGEVAKSDGEVAYSLPYGGATSFAEVEAWMSAQDKLYKAYDTWYTFETLASNIMGKEDIEDKPKALAQLMAECKDKLETKSFAIMEKIEKAMLEGESFVTKSETHPLDEAFAQMKSAFDNTVSSEMPDEEKLMALQPALDNLGNVLRESVKAQAVVTADEPVPSMGVDATQLKAIVEDVIAPIAEKVNILMQAQSAQAGRTVAPRQETVPQRRGLPAQSPLIAKASTSETPKLHEIVLRSVGLGGTERL
jgi:cation transport regulator